MRSRVCLVAILCCLVVVACLAGAASAWATAPTITSIGPNNGPSVGGTPVTITGTGFISGTTVKFGSTSATGVSIKSSTSITATSPAGSGTVGVSVTNSGGTSSSTPYDQYGYDPAPTGAWLGLNGNSSTYLGPVDTFVEHSIVYDRSSAIEWEAGYLPKAGDGLAKDVEDEMVPDITIEYKGYPGCEWEHECLPTGSAITTYVTGFVKSAEAALKEYPGEQIIFEPINEPYGYGTAAQYANIIAKLLPEAEKAGIPLSDIYVAAYGKKWVPKMYEAQSKLETEVQGWYFHPYGPAKGTAEENSEGIQSLPNVQAEMASGQNNIIVSEVGYCPEDVNGGEDCHGDSVANSTIAAADLTEMLDNALPYHQAGWLRDLIVYSRNDGGWAMQVSGGTLTKQGEALEAFADSYGLGWWAIQATTNPTEHSTLDGVSCASASFCVAVGNTANISGVTLAEKWNGTSWSTQSTPNPTGETNFVELKGVSCPSTSACMAVGSYNGSHGGVSLTEYWNGSTWTIKTTPSLTDDYALTKISCTSASACTAVGYRDSPGPQEPLIERWNGETETWTVQTASVPAGAEASELKGVSCTSSTSCIAAGYYRYEESNIPLVETWNGEKWVEVTAPLVWAWLSNISCTTSTACTAVGSEDAGVVIAERWNGSTWSNEPVPVPKGERGYESLSGVSCVSANRCTASGGYAPTVGELRPFAVNWNGKFWSLAVTPNPGGTFTDLEGLSCTEVTACTATGSSTPSAFTSATLAERFGG